MYDTGPGGVNEFGCSLAEILLTECPQKMGLVKGWANPTGVILLIILTLMVICSQAFVRKSGYFEVGNYLPVHQDVWCSTGLTCCTLHFYCQVYYCTHVLYIAFLPSGVSTGRTCCILSSCRLVFYWTHVLYIAFLSSGVLLDTRDVY